MRFRKKHFAIPEMEKSPQVVLNIDEKQKSWSEYFPTPTAPYTLELGVGKGKFIMEMAKRFPERNFLGVDIEPNAMIVAKRLMDEMQVPNVLLIRHDITKIQDVFPENFIDTIHIHFPNPWPKKRHYKRRLTHPRQLVQYHSFLKDNGKFFFKTDDYDLYIDSLAYLPRFGFKIDFFTDNLNPADDPTGIITEYEERWRGQGMPIKAISGHKQFIEHEKLIQTLEEFTQEEKVYRTKNPQA